MNFLLDAEAIAELTVRRGRARAHLEALVAHEPPYGLAYRQLQAICAHRRDANTLFWRWVLDEDGGKRVIQEIEAGAEIEDVHASIRGQLAQVMSSLGEPVDAPIRYARVTDLFLRHLASCEILSGQSRSRLVWEAPVALEAEVLTYLRRFVPALILGHVDGDVVDRQAAYDDLQRLVREITVRAGVPNLYLAAMAEIEAPDAARS